MYLRVRLSVRWRVRVFAKRCVGEFVYVCICVLVLFEYWYSPCVLVFAVSCIRVLVCLCIPVVLSLCVSVFVYSCICAFVYGCSEYSCIRVLVQ